MNNELISRSAVKDIAAKYGATEDFDSLIDQIPTVDAVEVVRCRDCENRSPSPFGHPHLRWCKILGDHCALDFYCGFGKRKEKAKHDQ